MSRNLAVAAAALMALGAPMSNYSSGPAQPLGGLRFNGHKFGPFALSTRERSRLAWRARVDAAARAYHSARVAWRARVRDGKFGTFEWQVFAELDSALAAPRPWRSPRKPDPRRRYSRSHRRACFRCRVATWMHLMFGVTRDPHGRSDR